MDVKFFLGFFLHSEIKMHLNQSSSWKEASLFQNPPLMQTKFEDKEYIGMVIPSPLPFIEIQQREQELKNILLQFCPKLSIDKHKIFLFPQLFLS